MTSVRETDDPKDNPVYLMQPVTREGGYTLTPEHEFTELFCDLETARRHLQFE